MFLNFILKNYKLYILRYNMLTFKHQYHLQDLVARLDAKNSIKLTQNSNDCDIIDIDYKGSNMTFKIDNINIYAKI